MRRIINFFNYIKFYFEGGENMMAMFFAGRVILGKIEFARVPNSLKPQVKELLEEMGVGELAIEG